MEPSRVVSLLRSPVTAAVVGGLGGLVPVGRATGALRAALVGAPAALVAAAVAVGQHHGAEEISSSVVAPEGSSLPAGAALPAAAAVLTAGVQWFSLVLDREAEAFLRRRGPPHPRLVLAGLSAVLVVALDPPGRADRAATGEVPGVAPADGHEPS